MSIGFILRKEPDESWLDAALRLAEPYGLEIEVRDDYERAVEAGEDEAEAAWSACYEWDVLPIDSSDDGEPD